MRARLCICLLFFLSVSSAVPQEPSFELDDRAALEAEAEGKDEAALAFYLKRLEELFGVLSTKDADAGAEPVRQARVLAEVYLARALALGRLSGAREIVAVLERLAALPAPPELRAQVDWALANQLLRVDRVKDARAVGDRLGFLRAWRVIGPFDNEAGRGFFSAYPPETDADLGASFDGDVRKVSWRAVTAEDATGYLNLDAYLRPNDEVLAYALAFVHVEAATPAILRIASDEGTRVWLNGEVVLSNDVRRAAGFDQDRVPVVLAPGWNRLLIKVAEAKGEWGIRVRFTDPQGAPLAGLTAGDRVPEGQALAGKLPPGAPAPPALPEGAMQILEREVKAHPEDPRRHFHLGILRENAHAEDRVKRSEAELFGTAATADDRNPHYHFFLALALKDEGASTPEREENRIRQELEFALQRFPKHAAAARELAWYYSRTLADIHEALGYADLACRINPDSPASRILLLELLKAGDLDAPMEIELQDVRKRFPDHPLVLARLAQRAFENHDYAKAEALYGKSLAADGLNPLARIGLAETLMHEGKMDEARAQYDIFLTFDPYALAAYLQKARIDEARGRWSEAAAETRRAVAICPEEEALLARLATQELMAGHAEEGLRLLKEALRLNPNSPQIREYVAVLAGSEQSFEKIYRVDPASVLAARSKGPLPPGKGAVCLLQNEVVRVNRDGTQSRYEQRFFQITSVEGVRDFDVVTIPHVAGEQKVTVLTARVHHPDGSADDARLERTAGGGGGEWRQWRRFPIDLPVLNVGDVVEIEHLLEDLSPSFFGDYFGDVVEFALAYEVADFRYTLAVPAERPIFFHPVHLTAQPEQAKSPDGRLTVYQWRLRDLPGFEPEPDMPDSDQVMPSLEISTFADWQAFATWYWSLIKKQHEADEAIREKVRELTETLVPEIDKIRAIYAFVTNEIRYVAWEFGVHGYQPYAATQIFHRGFGDCKDKALLLNVMLGELGIRSRPVLLFAEDKRSHLELPFPLVERFNHCISQVTLGSGERLYLDGTATFHGSRSLPAMDQGAPVLVVDDQGGTIQKTPLGRPEDNVREERLEVHVGASGPARLKGRATLIGPCAVEVRYRYKLREKRDQALEQDLSATYGEAHVEKTEFANMLRMEQPLLFSFDAVVRGFASARAGGRLAFRPTGSLHRLSDSCTLAERKFELLLDVPWRHVEKVEVELPTGYRTVSLPESKTLATPFGKFTARVTLAPETNRLTIEKELEIGVTRVGTAEYAAYRAFCNAVDTWESGEALLER